MIIIPQKVQDRFFAKTEWQEINGVRHLVWTGAKSNGYGNLGWQGQGISAHRMAFIIHYGREPVNLCLHKVECHYRACVWWEHLYDGTFSDNNRDAVLNGTSRKDQPVSLAT